MSHTDKVLEFLQSLGAGRCCDECLARRTRIKPAKAVTEACRKLSELGRLIRKRGKCPLGDHTKMLNSLATQPRRATGPRTRQGAPRDMGIEQAWRYVDRFCRALWARHLGDTPPDSLAEAITTLRDEELIPIHEASMMHTIRTLRNMVVHENPDFGDQENTIARAAWEIVRSWAEQRESDAWKLTVTRCAA